MGIVTTFELGEEHGVLTRIMEIFNVHPAGLYAYGTTVVQCMANEVLTVMSWLFTCNFIHFMSGSLMFCHIFGTYCCMCVVVMCSLTGNVLYRERSNIYFYSNGQHVI